jgi:hypothetical protein
VTSNARVTGSVSKLKAQAESSSDVAAAAGPAAAPATGAPGEGSNDAFKVVGGPSKQRTGGKKDMPCIIA